MPQERKTAGYLLLTVSRQHGELVACYARLRKTAHLKATRPEHADFFAALGIFE